MAKTKHGLQWSDALTNLDQAPVSDGRPSDPIWRHDFNDRQIDTLLDEQPRLPAGLITDAFAEALRELCSFVREAPHRYLWFVGD